MELFCENNRRQQITWRHPFNARMYRTVFLPKVTRIFYRLL
jgi:hypothetical protein